MRGKVYKISALVLGFFFALSATAFSEDKDEVKISGSAEVGVRVVDGERESAKFQEYREIKDGIFGKIKVNVEKGSYFLDLKVKNPGLDDQSYYLDGGRYGFFKYKIFYDEIIHNYSFDAKTFYSKPGSNYLTYYATNNSTVGPYTPNISTNPSDWQEFDYYKKRKKYGLDLNIAPKKQPFYIEASFNQQDIKGIYPIGAPSGVFRDQNGTQTSPFGNVVELPSPIDWKVNDLNFEIGYHHKIGYLALNFNYNKFNNEHDWLTWRNPYVRQTAFYEINSLPPDNDYYKWNLKGALKELPLNSFLGLNISYSRLKSDVDLLDTIGTSKTGNATALPTYSIRTLSLNDYTFNGDVKYTNYSAYLTSQPAKFLYTRVYYNYLKKKNDSDEIFYSNGTNSVENELFSYKKNNFGLDLTLKLSYKNKLMGGYEYLKIDRHGRKDAEETKDNKVYLEWKNDYFDYVVFKARYEKLWRDSDFGLSDEGSNKTDQYYIERFVRRFDATDKKMDVFKVGFEFYPVQNLTLGLEYAYKKNDYDETVLGRKEDRRNAYSLDITYALPESFKISAFLDYEDTKYKGMRRYINPSGNYSFDPYDPPVSNAYNWESTLKDKAYTLGAKLEVPIIKNKLTWFVSYLYEKGDGKVNLSSQNNIGSPLDIPDSDDYTWRIFETKFVYQFSPRVAFKLGYIYEKLKYKDPQFDGYTYIVGSPINTFLSGAYKDKEYDAHVGYFTVKFNF